MLANTGSVSLLEGRQDTDDREYGRQHVRDRDSHANRWFAVLAAREHCPAESLDDHVHRFAAVEIVCSKAAERAVDDRRIRRFCDRVADAQSVCGSCSEILDYDIGISNEIFENTLRSWRL